MFKWFKRTREPDPECKLAQKQLGWLYRANESQRSTILETIDLDELENILGVCSVNSSMFIYLLTRFEERKPPVDEPFPEGE